jgi:MFS family permease
MPSWPPRRARRLPRPFQRLIAALSAVSLADGIRAVALPLLAVELTRDPLLVASLGMAQSLPFLVFGLPAGVIVDRVDRRRLLVATNTVEATLFGLELCGVVLAAVPLPLLYLAALSLGTNETLRDTTAATALPAIVPSEQLEDGNGRLVAVEFVANQLAGPALGAALFALASALPFGLSGGLALVAAVLVQRLIAEPHANHRLAPRGRAGSPRSHGRRSQGCARPNRR